MNGKKESNMRDGTIEVDDINSNKIDPAEFLQVTLEDEPAEESITEEFI